MGQKLPEDYFSEQQSKIHDSHLEYHPIKQKSIQMSRTGLSLVRNQRSRYSTLSPLYCFWNNLCYNLLLVQNSYPTIPYLNIMSLKIQNSEGEGQNDWI